MRVWNGCLLIVCLALGGLGLSGCAGLSLVIHRSNPATQRIATAEALARFLEDQVEVVQAHQVAVVLAHPGQNVPGPEDAGGVTECHLIDIALAGGWECQVMGLLSPQEDPDDQGPALLDVAYRPSTKRFVERDLSPADAPLHFGGVAAASVLNSRSLRIRTDDSVQHVACARTSDSAWCLQFVSLPHFRINLNHVHIFVPASNVASQAIQENACAESSFCPPPLSAFK
jgi:hypothetical protein